MPHFFSGNANEAIDLYKKALQIIKDSSYMPLDDSMMENMRIDLAELLHVVGRYVRCVIKTKDLHALVDFNAWFSQALMINPLAISLNISRKGARFILDSL